MCVLWVLFFGLFDLLRVWVGSGFIVRLDFFNEGDVGG